MKYPDFLKPGGVIGFVAPSFGCDTEPYKSAFNHALEVFRGMGYFYKLGPNCYASEGIGISNTPQKCADELQEFYQGEDSDILISCGGGELMCEVLSHIDFDAIANSVPKWYMGYSDNTNFTFLLTTICDVASIYGPCASTFGQDPWNQSVKDAFDELIGKFRTARNYDSYEVMSLKNEDNPLATFNCTRSTDIKAFVPQDMSFEVPGNVFAGEAAEGQSVSRQANAELSGEGRSDEGQLVPERVMLTYDVYRDGEVCTQESPLRTDGVMLTNTASFSGRIIGGCMECLVSLIGTRFDHVAEFVEKYKQDGIIWYIEACYLSEYVFRANMWHMYEAGWFKYVKGFIFGRAGYGGDDFGLNRFDAALPVACRELKVPVIMDADIGHVPPSMPIINGSLAKVDFDNGHLMVRMSLS